MSADDGIYILKTPAESGFEYRVIHAQAIENIYYDRGRSHDEPIPKRLREYFGKAEVFTNETEAVKKAVAWHKTEQSEYGIREIEYSRPFPCRKQQNKR